MVQKSKDNPHSHFELFLISELNSFHLRLSQIISLDYIRSIESITARIELDIKGSRPSKKSWEAMDIFRKGGGGINSIP